MVCLVLGIFGVGYLGVEYFGVGYVGVFYVKLCTRCKERFWKSLFNNRISSDKNKHALEHGNDICG